MKQSYGRKVGKSGWKFEYSSSRLFDFFQRLKSSNFADRHWTVYLMA